MPLAGLIRNKSFLACRFESAMTKMLGHVSAALTLDVYADLFDDDLDAVGGALSAAGARQIVGMD